MLVEIHKEEGLWWWRLVGGTGELLAQGTAGHRRRGGAKAAWEKIAGAPAATIRVVEVL